MCYTGYNIMEKKMETTIIIIIPQVIEQLGCKAKARICAFRCVGSVGSSGIYKLTVSGCGIFVM